MAQREHGATQGRYAGHTSARDPTGEVTVVPLRLASRRDVRLAGLLHLPAGVAAVAGRPAVVLCHGMESTKDGTKHRALAARLSARGYVCLRFDFSYVGESEGAFEDLTISGEDRKSTRLNSSHLKLSRMPSSA